MKARSCAHLVCARLFNGLFNGLSFDGCAHMWVTTVSIATQLYSLNILTFYMLNLTNKLAGVGFGAGV